MAKTLDKNLLIAQNTFFMFVRMIVILIIGLITSRVLLQVLGVEDFGLFSVLGSICFFVGFLNNALRNATRRYLIFEIGKGSNINICRIFSMSINVHLLLAVLLFFILEIGGVWYINSKLVVNPTRLYASHVAFQAILINFCIEIMKVPYQSCIIAYEKMDFFAWSSVIEALFKLFSLFVVIHVGFDKLITYAVLLSFANFLIIVWYYYYCRTKFPEIRYTRFWNKSLFYSFFKFSGWSTMANGVDVVTLQGYNLLFNTFFGVVTNAALGISNQVRNLVALFVSNFASAYEPQITKSYACQEYGYFHKLVISSSKISGYLSLFIGIPIFINIDYLLDIWLVNPPKEAALFLKICIFHAFFDMIQAPLTCAVYATGDIKGHQILMTIIKILGLITSVILLVLGFEAYCVLACWVLCNAACSLARTIYLGNFINLNRLKYFKDVCLNCGLIILVYLPISIVVVGHTDGFIRLLVTSVMSTLVIVLYSYIWGLDENEKNIINEILCKYGIRKRH